MVVLFTDFGIASPYAGLLKNILHRQAPGVAVIDLLHDAPAFDPQAAAYLLATYAPEFPQQSVFVTVVDPGVGSARDGLILQADNRFYVGPDNGLLDRVAARAGQTRAWRITWRPERMSATFHGRDLFAPIAAHLACGASPAQFGSPASYQVYDWPANLPRIIYIDHYGNAMTGLRADTFPDDLSLLVHGRLLPRARTFADMPKGAGFCYANSSGLLEIAVNRGHAASQFELAVGETITTVTGQHCSRHSL